MEYILHNLQPTKLNTYILQNFDIGYKSIGDAIYYRTANVQNAFN